MTKKGIQLFVEDFLENASLKRYSKKVISPIYTPQSEIPPGISTLYSPIKYRELVKKIKDATTITKEERQFLLFAAARHIQFSFSNIAEYYAHASKEMQELMEDSYLVVIDFNKALEDGIVKLQERIANQYTTEQEQEQEHGKIL